MSTLKILLLQIRKLDPMRISEVTAFTDALNCSPEQISAADLINDPPSPEMLQRRSV